MQIFYTRYKEMKRVIRDDAAIDIQRCARGFVVRSRISRFSGMIFNSSESPGAKSKRGSGSKDMRKGSNSVPKYQLTHATSFSNTLAGKSVSHTHTFHCFFRKSFLLVVLTFLRSTFPASLNQRFQSHIISGISTQFFESSLPFSSAFHANHLTLQLSLLLLIITSYNHLSL
jgi:hypothetical protein